MTLGTTDVAGVLTQLGVDVRRVGDREISACCPVHERVTGRADGSPSWSMNAHTGLWICYSCGAKGTLSSLVSELSGEQDTIVAVHNLLIRSGLERLTATVKEEKRVEVDWHEFAKFRPPTDDRLRTRKISRESSQKYGIRFDVGSQSWILPITDQFGSLMGWQEKSKKFTRNYPVGVKKSETLFGIDKSDCSVGVLVESPLDVARLDTVMGGVCGVASFGAAISSAQIRLLSQHFDSLIVALDNDEAGVMSAKKLQKALPSFRRGVKWLHYAHTDAKDIGDMTHEEIVESVTRSSVFPWWVRV